LEESDEEVLTFAITDLRNRIKSGSKEMILPMDLNEYFPDNRISVPQRGDKKKLLDLSIRNAKSYRLDKRKQASSLKPLNARERILKTLQKDLRLQRIPLHIECFDNSNIQGSEPVAACVVFRNGKPYKKDYRHYNIKGVRGADDFASMEEVVYRRYRRLKEESQPLPQLIIIDGGKGQLNAALKSLDKLGLRGTIAIIGIAKKLEEIYFPDDPVPLYIDKNSESLKIIQNLRNEAHRFGINFHRQKRSGSMIKSQFGSIPGLGEKTIEKIFTQFKSMEGIRSASKEDIEAIVGRAKAQKLMEYLSKNKT
jgi:excinuclease ABC subunit C